MQVRCCWEHHGEDTMLHALDFPGVCSRGKNKAAAIAKMPQAIRAYCAWAKLDIPSAVMVIIVEACDSIARIEDGDSMVLFANEKENLAIEEYRKLKARCLMSANDFLRFYEAMPDKQSSSLPVRKTFYGSVPRTAEEMYVHTKNVNSYYWQNIHVMASDEGSILENRQRGFALLEQEAAFLSSHLYQAQDQEWWSLRKVLRRFLWHDRLHAKAMGRMAELQGWKVEDIFCFHTK